MDTVGPPFRKVMLYTRELTPRAELPEEMWEVLAPILFEGQESPNLHEAYPWFFARDARDRDGIVKYSEELDCLHEDLEFALFDLETAHEYSYSDRLLDVGSSIYYRRLALIYHADNVDVRVHAYREKVFQLLRHLLGIKDINDRDPNFNDKVRASVRLAGLTGIEVCLQALGKDLMIRAALQRRRFFTHQLRARADWTLLSSESRIDDDMSGLSDTAQAERYFNITSAYTQISRDINQLCETLAQFRFRFVEALKRSAASSPEMEG